MIEQVLTEIDHLTPIFSLTYEALKDSKSLRDQDFARSLDEDYEGLKWRLNQTGNRTSVPNLNSLPYANKLIASKKILKENVWGFPQNSCEMAAKVVNEVTGLEQVAGNYKYDPKSFHSWNFDFERGLFICISMDQYDETNDQITILPASTDILTVQEIPTKNQWLYDRADIQDYVAKIKSRLGEE